MGRAKFVAYSIGVIGLAAILVLAFVLSSKERTMITRGAYQPLSKGKVIAVSVETDGAGKHLGDEISYRVLVFYDKQKVVLDKKDLRKISFKPFRQIGMTEETRKVGERTEVYIQEHKLQLVSGQTNTIYFFEPLKIYWRQGQKVKKISVPRLPIYLSSRFPWGTGVGYPLQPLKGESEGGGERNPLLAPLIVAGGGVFLLILAAFLYYVYGFSATRSRNRKGDTARESIITAIHELAQTNPRLALHLMHESIRNELAREGVDWMTSSENENDDERFLFLSKLEAYTYIQEEPSPAQLEEMIQEFEKLREGGG